MTNKLYILATLSLMVISPSRGYGQMKDSSSLFLPLMEHLSPMARHSDMSRKNPAIHAEACSTDFSTAEAGYSMRREDMPATVQKGSGHDYGKFMARSFRRLSGKNSVWGHAGYRRGTIYDVRWNSTSDYDIIYPYVTADSLGGNLTSEEYTAGGGYGHRTGRWSWGIEGNLRASHEYRTVNPRPRNIVTDIDASAGAAFTAGKVRIGLHIRTEIYRQRSDVDFYGDKGIIGEYFMSGLGAHYARFKGNDNGTMFKGHSWSAGISVIPDSHKDGFYFSALYNRQITEKTLTDKNKLPLQKAVPNTVSAMFAWTGGKGSRYLWGISASSSYRYTGGYESIVAENISNEYRSLGELEMFQSDKLSVRVDGTWGQDTDKASWYLTPGIRYMSSREIYRYPRQCEEWAYLTAGTGFLYRRYIRRTALEIEAGTFWRQCISETMDIPTATLEPSMAGMLRSNHLMASSDYVQGRIKLRADFMTGKNLDIYVSAGYILSVTVPGCVKMQTAEAALGIAF